MADRLLEDRHDGGIVVVTINRPPANALTAEFLLEIEAKLNSLEDDQDVRAVVLTGREKILSAGLDLKELPNLDEKGHQRTLDTINSVYYQLYNFAKPLIVAASGHAIAGGFFLVLVGDYRIGIEGGAQYGLTEVRVGVPFPVCLIEIVRSELPAHVARRMLLQGRTVDGTAVRAWGILDEIVPPNVLIERAIEVAREYAEQPAGAYAVIKRQLRAPALAHMKNAIENGDDPVRNIWFDELP